MLHHKGAVSLFYAFHNDLVFDISAIDIVIFKIAVAPGNDGFANKTLNGQFAVMIGHRQQFPGNIPAIDLVNDLL